MRSVDIHASCRESDKENFRVLCDLTSNQNFLDISTGHLADRSGNTRCHDFKLIFNLLCKGSRTFTVEERTFAVAVASKHHIIGHIHVSDESHTDTVLRNESKTDSCFIDRNGIHSGKFHSASIVIQKSDGTTFYILQPGDRLQKFLLAASGNTGNTKDLTCVYCQIYIIQSFDIVFVLTVYAFNDQARLYILRLRTLDIQVNSCANHHFRKALHICLGSFHSVNILAFTEDRHAVRQCKNLLQFMRDNDDRTSVISHVTKDIK